MILILMKFLFLMNVKMMKLIMLISIKSIVIKKYFHNRGKKNILLNLNKFNLFFIEKQFKKRIGKQFLKIIIVKKKYY